MIEINLGLEQHESETAITDFSIFEQTNLIKISFI